MRRIPLFELETPYREPMVVWGFEFGDEGGHPAAAVVGSTRGNEVQQLFVCSHLVDRLARAEARGQVRRGERILVVPCVNPISMNVSQRFWPLDGTDINRMFPGQADGETTQRVAAGVFDVVSKYALGIQLCSFYMPGEFEPHVRITHEGPISDESDAMADAFGLPFVVENDPDPFDTVMLNYNWQSWGTHAFSLYSRTTDSLDPKSAAEVERATMRFLMAQGLVSGRPTKGVIPRHVREADLTNVRTERAGGFFLRKVGPGQHVVEGQVLAEVADTLDSHVRETIVSPVAGEVLFARSVALVQQDIICFRIVPDGR